MRDIALYYPNIHVRDDAWLKAAALYWPKIARLAPSGYPKHDSETARRLSGELGFILDIHPGRYAQDIAEKFGHFIWANRYALQSRYSVRHLFRPEDPNYAWSRVYGNPEYGLIKLGKMEDGLSSPLFQLGLGVMGLKDEVFVASELAAVYIGALADRVAIANDLAVVTDEPDAHGTILNGCDFDTLAQVLLRDDKAEPVLGTDEIGAMYAAVAVRTVVPARINDIPVQKIIKARRELGAEFDAFRDHLDSLADRLTELGRIKDETVLHARLELMVERDLRRPVDELERKLRQLGLEPARAVLGLKSLELPAAAAAAASAAAFPPGVGEAGLVAGRLITSALGTRAMRRRIQQSGPAGYLLGLQKELTPGGVIDRLRRTLRRAVHRAQRHDSA